MKNPNAESKTYKFWTIVFMQGDEANEPLQILEDSGEDSAIEYLSQWDFGGESEHCMSGSETEPWGSSDYVYEANGYILSYNTHFGYIGLTREVK